MHLVRQELDQGWELSLASAHPAHRPPALPAAVPATVPGCVHTDLLASGLIPDPYLDENELALDWIGHQQWSYRTRFAVPTGDAQRIDLVCEGLDTVATVLINDREVGQFFNQHRSYRIPLSEVLVEGDNEVEVIFHSAWAYADQVQRDLGALPNAYPTPFNFIRKMACNFGWDWGPTVVTAGIWKPMAIEMWSEARLARVRPTATVRGALGHVCVQVDVERANEAELTVRARIAGEEIAISIPAGGTSGEIDLDVADIELWWPHDLGSQPLYGLTVELLAQDRVLDSWTDRIGFRSIRLDTSADEVGSAFTLVINDVPIFIRGANWIPDDCFPSRITRERLRTRIGQGADANVNLLRVWGGGMYESADFYGLCDELGVLVWQDFLFACAAYPEENPIRDEVIAEATENIARLMPHPSLVLWDGCNENIWGWFDWSWQEPIGNRTWGLGYYLDILPGLMSAVDPSRPYYPGSPFSGTMDIHPNVDNHGLRHIWDVWNSTDYSHYREHIPASSLNSDIRDHPTPRPSGGRSTTSR